MLLALGVGESRLALRLIACELAIVQLLHGIAIDVLIEVYLPNPQQSELGLKPVYVGCGVLMEIS